MELRVHDGRRVLRRLDAVIPARNDPVGLLSPVQHELGPSASAVTYKGLIYMKAVWSNWPGLREDEGSKALNKIVIDKSESLLNGPLVITYFRHLPDVVRWR